METIVDIKRKKHLSRHKERVIVKIIFREETITKRNEKERIWNRFWQFASVSFYHGIYSSSEFTVSNAVKSAPAFSTFSAAYSLKTKSTKFSSELPRPSIFPETCEENTKCRQTLVVLALLCAKFRVSGASLVN